MGAWAMSEDTSEQCCNGEIYSQDKYGLCEKQAYGELPRDGRTKRWQFVWNSMDANTLWECEWNLFASEDTGCSPVLSLCLRNVSMWTWGPKCSHTLSRPHFFQDTLFNGKALGLIFYAVSCLRRSAAAWHALRQKITHLEQMTNANSPRVNQFLNWVWIEPAESISSDSKLMAMGNVHEIC